MAAIRPRVAFSWRSFEAWVGTRGSAMALFGIALAGFAVESIFLPAYPGRDFARYVEAFAQLAWQTPIVPSVMNTRGPLADVGVGLPLEAGGWATEIWLALLYALSIVAWARVALYFGSRAAIATSVVLLVYPGYGILYHGMSSDSLFAAAFAGWALVLSRAIARPSIGSFLLVGIGLGLLVLVRPANQVLIVFALLPLLLRAPWGRRLSWMAAVFIPSALLTQAWKAFATWRYGKELGLTPSATVLLASIVLLPLLLPAPWRRRLALGLAVVAIPVVAAAVVVRGANIQSPSHYARALAQSPGGNVFLFRAFELDRIVAPENGPASRQMGRVVQRQLLEKEPYRSYGVDLHTFFSSGSDRMFGDFTSTPGVDFAAVTQEAIQRHRWTFATSIAETIWQMLWSKRVYVPEGSGAATSANGAGSGQAGTRSVDKQGKTLPKPSDQQPIPASRVGLVIQTLYGPAGEVWLSATKHPLVFADPRDKRRYEKFQRDTGRLADRIPTRDGDPALVHRLNQASHVFPPPIVWLIVGLAAMAFRRPKRALVALAPTAAGLVVIVATGIIAPAVAEYAAPVSPAFVLLAAAGVLGAGPRGWGRGHDRVRARVS